MRPTLGIPTLIVLAISCAPPPDCPAEERTSGAETSPRAAGPQSHASAPESAPTSPDAEPVPPSSVPPSTVQRSTVQRLEEDLDGDGAPEVIELLTDGTLRIDGAERRLELHQEPGSYWWERWAPQALRVIDGRRGDGHREILLWQYAGGDEDPGREYDLFFLRSDGSVGAPLDPIAVGHATEPSTPGDGRILFRDERCVTDGRSAELRVELEVARDGEVRPVLEQTRYRASQCVLVACPHVYVGAPTRAYVGEILRDIRGPEAETEQTLTIPASAIGADGALTLTIREEEPEITYLDAVRVWADGRELAPRGCSSPAAVHDLACAGDGDRLVLREGDERVFTFDVGGPARHVVVIARGYYVRLAEPLAR